MTTSPISGAPLRGTDSRRSHGVGAAGAGSEAVSPVIGAKRADRVDISAEGRAQALADARASALPAPAGEDRLGEIRARIESGMYDNPEVADEVAKKLLSSGDL